MPDLFADTSGWAAFLVARDPMHAQADAAVRGTRRGGQKLITTHLILAELVALLTRPFRISRSRQVQYLNLIRAAPWVEVVPCDPAFDAETWALWEARPDKEWSSSIVPVS